MKPRGPGAHSQAALLWLLTGDARGWGPTGQARRQRHTGTVPPQCRQQLARRETVPGSHSGNNIQHAPASPPTCTHAHLGPGPSLTAGHAGVCVGTKLCPAPVNGTYFSLTDVWE